MRRCIQRQHVQAGTLSVNARRSSKMCTELADEKKKRTVFFALFMLNYLSKLERSHWGWKDPNIEQQKSLNYRVNRRTKCTTYVSAAFPQCTLLYREIYFQPLECCKFCKIIAVLLSSPNENYCQLWKKSRIFFIKRRQSRKWNFGTVLLVPS